MKTRAILCILGVVAVCWASPVPADISTQQDSESQSEPVAEDHLVWFSNGKAQSQPVMESNGDEEHEEVVVIEDPQSDEQQSDEGELAEGEEIDVKEPANLQPKLDEQQPTELTDYESISVKAPLLLDPSEDRPMATLELKEGEEITVREPNVSAEELPPLLLSESDVQVSEWHDTTSSPEPSQEQINMLIDSANAVSSPWQDVMVAGLPPSVAYNWQFLMDLSGKLRTADNEKQMVSLTAASTTPKDTSINTRLKYVINKIQGAYPTMVPILDGKIDNLKQQYQMKTKLQTSGVEGDTLKWAWRRAALSP